MDNLAEITVQTYKFDGKPHRKWNAELLEQNGDLLVLRGVFDQKIEHSNLGVIQAGTLSYEYYWLDRWYNVFRFHEPDGSLRNYYCNINQPPTFENDELSYIDLDVDLYVSPAFEVEVWDMDEFLENSLKHEYPAKIIENVKKSIHELNEMITARAFPFDHSEK